jgi:restriction endonuclease S subunit
MKKVKLSSVAKDLTNERKIIISEDEEIVEPTITSKSHSISIRKISKGRDLKIKKRVLLKKDDLVFSKLHTQNGSFAFADREYQSTTTFLPLKILEDKILKEFLFNQLHLLVPKLQASDTVGRETYKTKDILGMGINLPSLKEQKQILNKIQSIEKEIKQLENNVSYDKLLLSKLKQSILQEAVQGKLVEQDPKDEPASELLKRIKKEKEKLIKEGKIKKQKSLPEISEDEIPYELPEGWVWTRLGEVCTLITDGTHYTPKYVKEGVPFLSVKDMSNGKINFSNSKFISKEEHEELNKRCKPEYMDLLLTKVGTTGIGRLVDTKQEFNIFVSVALLKYSQELIYPYYLEHLINSPFVKNQSSEGTEGVGNKNLVLRKIVNFLVPLPPLPEQKRIVEKVDSLMKFCDELEEKIKHNKESSENLMSTVLRESFED